MNVQADERSFVSKHSTVVLFLDFQFMFVCVAFIIGFLYDSTLNYNIPFLVTGMMQAIGGLLGFVIYLVIRCRRTRLH